MTTWVHDPHIFRFQNDLVHVLVLLFLRYRNKRYRRRSVRPPIDVPEFLCIRVHECIISWYFRRHLFRMIELFDTSPRMKQLSENRRHGKQIDLLALAPGFPRIVWEEWKEDLRYPDGRSDEDTLRHWPSLDNSLELIRLSNAFRIGARFNWMYSMYRGMVLI